MHGDRSLRTELVRCAAAMPSDYWQKITFMLGVGALWLAIGIYSAYATFSGFQRLNWGYFALILTGLTQLGAMLYPFVLTAASRQATRGSWWRRMLLVLLLAIIFHALSFSGSVYHHRAATLVRAEYRHVQQYRRLLGDMAAAASFNAREPFTELRRLQGFYLRKAQEEESGLGITGRPTVGPYAKAYARLAQACDNIALQYMPPELPSTPELSETTTNEQAFASIDSFYRSLPQAALRSGGDFSEAPLVLETWRVNAPAPIPPGDRAMDRAGWEASRFDIAHAENLVRRHLGSFPYVKVPEPAAVVGEPELVVGLVSSAWVDLRSAVPSKRASAEAGLLGAAVTEIVTLVLNLLMAVTWGRWKGRYQPLYLADLLSSVAMSERAPVEEDRYSSAIGRLYDSSLSLVNIAERRETGSELVALFEDTRSLKATGNDETLKALVYWGRRANLVTLDWNSAAYELRCTHLWQWLIAAREVVERASVDSSKSARRSSAWSTVVRGRVNQPSRHTDDVLAINPTGRTSSSKVAATGLASDRTS